MFLLNLPLAVLVVFATRHAVPESADPDSRRHIDVAGSLLLVLGLGATVWGLIDSGGTGHVSPRSASGIVVGLLLLVAFAMVERHRRDPMVPPEVFTVRQFQAVNAVTLLVYAGLGAVFFLLVLHLQTVLGYSALAAGAASAPVTVLLLVLSPGAGALAQRIGPQLQMTVGPLTMAVAALLLGQVDAGDDYLSAVLPAVALFGLGLAATVAPLTASALASVADRHAGVASGVNTAVARTAQLAPWR